MHVGDAVIVGFGAGVSENEPLPVAEREFERVLAGD